MASVAKRTWETNGVKKSAWTVRYVDRGGAHRQKTFEKKKDADLYRSKTELDLSRRIHSAAAERITVEQAAAAFLKAMEDRVKDGVIGETHRARVEISIRLHVVPYLGRMKLDELNLPILEDWFKEMRAARDLSKRTATYAAQALKMIFDHAVKREWTYKNPVPQLLAEKRGGKAEPVVTFTVEQARAVLRAASVPMYKGRTPDAALRLECAVHLAAFCGLRQGEIFGLRRENVDFSAGVVRVRNSLSRKDGLKGPKSRAGTRDIAMPAHVSNLLQTWLNLHQVETGPANPHGLMFTYKTGRPMNADGFRHGSWGPLLVRAGLATDYMKPTFHFHALRHFATSWMIDAGWSLPEVAGAMGHAKVDTTMSVYAHALQGRAVSGAQMQQLSDRLLPPPVTERAQIAQG